jgi:GTPase SAR1 family protein
MENKSGLYKIILSGLDNAGKTSLLIALENIYGFEKVVSKLEPTMNIKYKTRSFLGKTLSYWDFGGQTQFREKYLKNPEYFMEIKSMIFLIDLQDETRYTEAVNYLGQILTILKGTDYDHKAPILICLSKADRTVISDASFEYSGKITMIKNIINKSYPLYQFKFFSSSIYDLFSLTALHLACIHDMFEEIPMLESAANTLAMNSSLMRAIVIDKSGLPFVDFIPDKLKTEIPQETINSALNYHLPLFRQFAEHNIAFSERKDQMESLQVCFYQLTSPLQIDDKNKSHGLLSKLKIGEKSKPPAPSFFINLFFPLPKSKQNESSTQMFIEQAKKILHLEK